MDGYSFALPYFAPPEIDRNAFLPSLCTGGWVPTVLHSALDYVASIDANTIDSVPSPRARQELLDHIKECIVRIQSDTSFCLTQLNKEQKTLRTWVTVGAILTGAGVVVAVAGSMLPPSHDARLAVLVTGGASGVVGLLVAAWAHFTSQSRIQSRQHLLQIQGDCQAYRARLLGDDTSTRS